MDKFSFSKTEKIVEYPFEKNEKSNVLAIHPTRPLIAYLITIQRTPRISKAWSSSSDHHDSNSSICSTDKNKTVSIRIIDYVTRQKCLARGIYHARPAACAFTINSLLCTDSGVIKLAVADRSSNIYLYDLTYFNNDLTSSRTLVIRSPFNSDSPLNSIHLVWCPYVPCEDFDDGDGGLRLALATNSSIEIFAVDRLQSKTGEVQRSDVKGAYKLIKDAHESKISSLNISPDCSTISAASSDDNRMKFFSCEMYDTNQRCLHNWEARSVNGQISKIFFLDDYPRLLEDSNMLFWGSALIATKSGHIVLIDLKAWNTYQSIPLKSDEVSGKFDYQIDFTSKCVIAICKLTAFVVHISHDQNHSNSLSLPRISRVSKFSLHSPIYSYVIKLKSDEELDLFTISANSLERLTLNISAIDNKDLVHDVQSQSHLTPETRHSSSTPNDLQKFFNAFDTGVRLASSGISNNISGLDEISAVSSGLSNKTVPSTLNNSSSVAEGIAEITTNSKSTTNNSVTKSNLKVSGEIAAVDKMVEVLFNKLNTAFSQGLEEFFTDVRGEVNDLKLKINGLSRDVRKLQQQLMEVVQR